MHPVLILIPAAALIFGPRLWVKRVLNQHNRKEQDFSVTGGELARQLLDRHQLYSVKVQSTDLGDHYDPDAKAVRLTRDKFERKTLTALTTAAHEVGHALQHASDYGPFLWRARLVQVAQVTVEAGSVILIAVPAAALMTRNPVPPIVVGSAILAMLGAGLAAQLAALPTELDASFSKALPMLKDGYISGEQAKDARNILIACSLTYVAASFAGVLHIWPWLGPRPALVGLGNPRSVVRLDGTATRMAGQRKQRHERGNLGASRARKRKGARFGEALARQFGKPIIRGWLRLTHSP